MTSTYWRGQQLCFLKTSNFNWLVFSPWSKLIWWENMLFNQLIAILTVTLFILIHTQLLFCRLSNPSMSQWEIDLSLSKDETTPCQHDNTLSVTPCHTLSHLVSMLAPWKPHLVRILSEPSQHASTLSATPCQQLMSAWIQVGEPD